MKQSRISDHTYRARVLMLTHRMPYPPDRGDRIRSWHLLQTLSKHCDVSLACTSDERITKQQRAAVKEHVKQLAVLRISPTASKMRGLAGLAKGQPITPSAFYRRSLAEKIQVWHMRNPFNTVLTFCTGMAQYAKHIHAARQVLDLVDVDSVKWDSYAADSRAPMRWIYAAEAKRLRTIERDAAGMFDAMTVVSEREAEAYRNVIGETDKLHVVGNGVDIDYFQPSVEQASKTNRNITFIGVMDYKPNVDAVCWFAKEVFPRIVLLFPNARFSIVGRNPSPEVRELDKRDGINVTGSVKDVRPYMQQAAAVVAPLQIARGVQNKILEAMAAGRAVVSSPEAAAGVNATPGRHLLVAHQQSQWVRLLSEVLSNEEYRQKLAASARQHVEQQYTWDARLSPMVQLVDPTIARLATHAQAA